MGYAGITDLVNGVVVIAVVTVVAVSIGLLIRFGPPGLLDFRRSTARAELEFVQHIGADKSQALGRLALLNLVVLIVFTLTLTGFASIGVVSASHRDAAPWLTVEFLMGCAMGSVVAETIIALHYGLLLLHILVDPVRLKKHLSHVAGEPAVGTR